MRVNNMKNFGSRSRAWHTDSSLLLVEKRLSHGARLFKVSVGDLLPPPRCLINPAPNAITAGDLAHLLDREPIEGRLDGIDRLSSRPWELFLHEGGQVTDRLAHRVSYMDPFSARWMDGSICLSAEPPE